MHDGKWCLMKFSLRALINMMNKHARKVVLKCQTTTGLEITTHTTKLFRRTRVRT